MTWIDPTPKVLPPFVRNADGTVGIDPEQLRLLSKEIQEDVQQIQNALANTKKTNIVFKTPMRVGGNLRA